jgi:hypothetical protein
MEVNSVKKQRSSIYEGGHERQTKKEIEAKWQRLTAHPDKSPKAKSSAIPAGARVIRRRKGRQDLPIV